MTQTLSPAVYLIFIPVCFPTQNRVKHFYSTNSSRTHEDAHIHNRSFQRIQTSTAGIILNLIKQIYINHTNSQ